MPNNNSPEHNERQPNLDKSNNDSSLNGFHGQYDFKIKDILNRSYQLSAQNNWTIVLALMCIIALTFVIYILYLHAFEITDFALLMTEESPLTQNQQAIIELTLTVVLAPLWAGVAMLAIATNRKESQSALSIFEYYKMLPSLALASGFISIFLTLGLALFFIPGFYIFTVTTFSLPLIADKKMGPIKAIVCSTRMSNIYIWKMLQLYLIFLLMLFLVVVSFGIAYLWVGPLYFNAKAVLYQDLFCTKRAVEDQNNTNEKQGLFDA